MIYFYLNVKILKIDKLSIKKSIIFHLELPLRSITMCHFCKKNRLPNDHLTVDCVNREFAYSKYWMHGKPMTPHSLSCQYCDKFQPHIVETHANPDVEVVVIYSYYICMICDSFTNHSEEAVSTNL